MKKYIFSLVVGSVAISAAAQTEEGKNKFAQMHTELPTPNVYRTASGAPGPQYWQQQADYNISIRLDEDNHTVYGEETVTYFNNSPDVLTYIWLQLDQNMRAKDSDTFKISQSTLGDSISQRQMDRLTPWFDGGFKLEMVQDNKGNDLPHTVVKTMMRIDLPKPLVPNSAYTFRIKWHYLINNRGLMGGRSGYEFFEKENNALYTIAQFYPRMAVYSDDQGWKHKQFLGSGEFTLPFGNYDVRITVPADHMLGATGELQNPREVLSDKEIERYNKARTADKPVIIRTQQEAEDLEKGRATSTKTWHFKANNVRDFAFATSRKLIWDAMGVKFGDRTVMAMSYYPKEGNPLWEQYSTKVVAHTLRVYSKYTFDYPYPAAISVNTSNIGMEYPMICFNGGRCEPDGTYSKRTKYGMIGVIMHEVGHNYFPMIVNSDERQWTWMDEGLNTFVQYLTEQEFERDYPSRRGEPRNIVDYMTGDPAKLEPIMTNSESIHQLGSNAYSKPTTALNILRETVMGRELFDFAFKTYANRWKFKHPEPADFFRTMEDASGVDLDWFWRGWFYSTQKVDLSLDYVKWAQMSTPVAGSSRMEATENDAREHPSITKIRNEKSIAITLLEADTTLRDFYSTYDAKKVTQTDEQDVAKEIESTGDTTADTTHGDKQFYELGISNVGGLPMPVILEFTYEDGSTEIHHIPAEIWKMGDATVTKVFITDKPIRSVVMDPYLQIADVDLSNNTWPAGADSAPTRIQLYKDRRDGRASSRQNEMQKSRRGQE